MSRDTPCQSPLATPGPWDAVAAAYADRVRALFAAFAATALDLAAVAAGERVVDVACGPGTLALLAAERGARVAALDFAPARLKCLAADAAAKGYRELVISAGD